MTGARPYHHGNLRAALLDAAESSIEKHGTEQLSLRELARTLGVSHGAPRSHFPDRQALLDALAERGFQRLSADLRRSSENPRSTFETRLQTTAATYVAFASANPALAELMYAVKPRTDARELQAAMAEVFSVVRGLISEGISDGVLAARDPEYYALLLFSWVRGIASLVTSGVADADTVSQLVDDSVAIFIRGSGAVS